MSLTHDQLHQLVVTTWWNEMDYLEPSICPIRAHPDTSEIILYGHDLLRSAFQPPAHGHSNIHPSVGKMEVGRYS